ncbi:MAG TPA: Uma2 family endonuclease [Pyrinomonadaceae bacterium]|jgi:Uma2 family endonuclease
MSTTTQTMTADELFMLPDEDHRYDLIKGELRKMSPAGAEHGALAARLTGALMQYVEQHELGEVFGAETGFKLASNPDTVLGPDLAFVSKERIPPTGIPVTYWPGAPDLAVEVVSPGNPRREIEEKIAAYLAAGVRLVWIISPSRRVVTVHRPNIEPLTLGENDTLDGQDVIPGFQHNVGRIFNRQRNRQQSDLS